jgi:spermidine synthase
MLKYSQKANRGDHITRKIDRVLAHGETRFQEYLFFESTIHGTCMALDGDLQSCASDEALYHEALVHPAMLLHPDPKNVLILGGADGAAAREAFRHPGVEKAVLVEIDEELFALCKRWIPTQGESAFNDPRLEVHYQDINVYLDQTEDCFDVVIANAIDLNDWESSTSNLYNKSFYNRLKEHLNEGAILATQGGALVPNELEAHLHLRDMVSENFGFIKTYGYPIPSFYHLWGFILASDSEIEVRPDVLCKQFSTTGKARGVYPHASGTLSLAAGFALPSVVHRQFNL